MTCKDLGIIAKIFSRSQPAIIKGSDFTFVTQVVYKGQEDSSYRIDGFIGATGFFGNQDGTILDIPGTLESADLGQVGFSLSEAQSLNLKAGEEESFEMSMEDSTGLKFFQFDGKLVIKDRLF